MIRHCRFGIVSGSYFGGSVRSKIRVYYFVNGYWCAERNMNMSNMITYCCWRRR